VRGLVLPLMVMGSQDDVLVGADTARNRRAED
jgi:hypothetical protein